ncbi:MAG: hypothetical protein FWF81_11110 [Defluviitaleaceae bacterium]|nr:hypothetical protein [Defluviitaleaceae bacterium]
MKKVILGTGLIVCGVLGVLTDIIIEVLFFTSPHTVARGGGTNPFFYFSIIVIIIGIALNVLGFLEDK